MGTVTSTSPQLYTFLRYPSMPSHNNTTEVEIRESVVLNRNMRHYMWERK